MSLKVKDLANAMFSHLQDVGWEADKDFLTWGEGQEGANSLLAFQAVQWLAQKTLIAQRRGNDGTTMGWGVSSKPQLPKRGPHGNLSDWLFLTMRLDQPCLGSESEDGLNFKLERDADGKPTFNRAHFLAMLEKAAKVSDLLPDKAGDLPTRTSIGYWAVIFDGVKLNGNGIPTQPHSRRIVNRQKQAVGEAKHEHLPPGTEINWRVRWPGTDWTDLNAVILLKSAEEIGFSPAANGEHGGNHGKFRWTNLPEVDYEAALQGQAESTPSQDSSP